MKSQGKLRWPVPHKEANSKYLFLVNWLLHFAKGCPHHSCFIPTPTPLQAGAATISLPLLCPCQWSLLPWPSGVMIKEAQTRLDQPPLGGKSPVFQRGTRCHPAEQLFEQHPSSLSCLIVTLSDVCERTLLSKPPEIYSSSFVTYLVAWFSKTNYRNYLRLICERKHVVWCKSSIYALVNRQ